MNKIPGYYPEKIEAFYQNVNTDFATKEELELSTQILIHEALKRNIHVDMLDQETNFIRLSKNNHQEYIRQATFTSQDSLISYFIMENKTITKSVLGAAGIKVPAGKLYQSAEEAQKDYLILNDKKLIVKPNNTNFGIGVHQINPNDELSFTKAIKDAFQHSDYVIIEEFIPGTEYRFFVIQEKVHAIVERIPANVVGDGVLNIQELVAQKNKSIYRGKDYSYPLIHIHLGKIEQQELQKQNLTPKTVPTKDQRIFLRTNSNISTGGDSIDVTDKIEEKYKQVAVRASQAAGAKICGVDMIITENQYAVIELNFNPAIHIHTFPGEGKGRNLAGPLLDLLNWPPNSD